MHPQQTNIEAAIAALNTAKEAVDNHLSHPEIVGVKNRTVSLLDQNIGQLSALIGSDMVTGSTSAAPLKKIFGKTIGKTEDNAGTDEAGSTGTGDLNPEAQEFKDSVSKLMENFTELETDKILDENPEIIIRGVAKLAGLPVTEKSPKKIDAKYVEKIKEAIAAKKKIDEAGSTGTGDNNNGGNTGNTGNTQ